MIKKKKEVCFHHCAALTIGILFMNELTKFIEEELGIILRRARKKKGWTMEEVAKKMGTSVDEIERIELHTGKVSLGMLQKYAEVVDKKIQLKFFNQ